MTTISPKGNGRGQIEFEICYNNVTVQYVSHYATKTHLEIDLGSTFRYIEPLGISKGNKHKW